MRTKLVILLEQSKLSTPLRLYRRPRVIGGGECISAVVITLVLLYTQALYQRHDRAKLSVVPTLVQQKAMSWSEVNACMVRHLGFEVLKWLPF